MKLAAVALLAVGAWAACDTSTCFVCKQMPGCQWYTGPGGVSDCRVNDTHLADLGFTAAPTCPACQAGSCTDCQNQTTCAWYIHPSILMRSVCGNDTTTPPTPNGITGTYNKTAPGMCPPCKDLPGGCTGCNANPNCTWYKLPGAAASDGKCAEIAASPGFAYTRVTTSFCNGGNPCSGQQTCADCKDANGTLPDNSMGNPCQWLVPKAGMAALYNPKCDYNYGTFDSGFYDPADTCPPCTGTTCGACKADTTCKWVAVVVAGVNSFGQCIQTSAAVPTGKSVVDVCPDTCKIYSCSQCVANSDCRWYTKSPIRDDSCDRASDVNQHLDAESVSTVDKCPACKASRCFECNNEAGCGWYINTAFGQDTFGTECAPTAASHTNERLVPNTDKKCDGASDGFAVKPSLLALFVALTVFYN